MQPRRVLVIEDDDAVRLALEVFLSSEDGIGEVETAADGSSGVEAARRLEPDVIVTDSSMPGVSGGDLGRALRDSCPAATIVSFSGLLQDAPWADHRIQKGGPETFDQLAQAVAGATPRPAPVAPARPRDRLAHDLRNVLTPVGGYASLLESGVDQMDAEQVREIAQRMLAAVDRALGMIDSL